MSQPLPKRSALELADALCQRADLLCGEPWETPATAAMMREAALGLRAAEARCTALQQQLAELQKRADSIDEDGRPTSFAALCDSIDSKYVEASVYEHCIWLHRSHDKLEKQLADLRGSITRLIAQWREKEKDGDEGFDMCADELEAALTRQGENT